MFTMYIFVYDVYCAQALYKYLLAEKNKLGDNIFTEKNEGKCQKVTVKIIESAGLLGLGFMGRREAEPARFP